jgi:hypothetical protein
MADLADQLACYLAYPPCRQLPFATAAHASMGRSAPHGLRDATARERSPARGHSAPAGQAWSRRGALAPKAVFQRIGHTYASVPRRWFAYRTDRRQPSLPAGRRNLLSCGVRGWMLGRQPRCRGRAPRGRLGVDLSPRKPEAREISEDLVRPLPRPMGIGETRPPPVRPDLEVDSSSATQEGASRCWMRSTLNHHQHSVVW